MPVTNALGTVWKYSGKWYDKKRRKRPELWKYITGWIDGHPQVNIIEVGGGNCFLADRAAGYTGIEMNEDVAAHLFQSDGASKQIICADWMRMDAGAIRKPPNTPTVFVALAVAEHCYHLYPFLDQVLRLGPQYALISFFQGLSRPADRIRTITRECHDGLLWKNEYSINTVWGWAAANNLADRCYPMLLDNGSRRRRDALLGLDFSDRQDAGFHISKELENKSTPVSCS